jgi:hypothetical protein
VRRVKRTRIKLISETIQDQLRKYEALLLKAVTPQRMRMIVHAFEDTLDKGLKKDGQVVVSTSYLSWASLTIAHE